MRFILFVLLAACGSEVIVESSPEPVDTVDTSTPADERVAPDPECRVDEDCQLDCCPGKCFCVGVPSTMPLEDCEPENCGIVPPPPMIAACVAGSCTALESD